MIHSPTLNDIKSVLFIQPHPDDNEIGAGGTMALLAQKGIPVYSLTVTKGDGGSDHLDPETLSAIRASEAQKASDILGVTYLGSLNYCNQNPGTVETICEDIVKIMRQHKVQTIISVDPDLDNEIHPVHLTVGQAVNQAFLRCGQPFYPFHTQTAHKDAYNPDILGHYFTKKDNTVVDISAVFDLKMQAVKAHQSQMAPGFEEAIHMLARANATFTPYPVAERLKLLSRLETHCFAIRDEILEVLRKESA